jgi:hypothetical protein
MTVAAPPLSYPFALARVERSDLPYAFSFRESLPECD